MVCMKHEAVLPNLIGDEEYITKEVFQTLSDKVDLLHGQIDYVIHYLKLSKGNE